MSIVKENLTTAQMISELLGISLKSAYNKLNGVTNFTLSEYLYMVEKLGDSMACSLIKNNKLINDTNKRKVKED